MSDCANNADKNEWLGRLWMTFLANSAEIFRFFFRRRHQPSGEFRDFDTSLTMLGIECLSSEDILKSDAHLTMDIRNATHNKHSVKIFDLVEYGRLRACLKVRKQMIADKNWNEEEHVEAQSTNSSLIDGMKNTST